MWQLALFSVAKERKVSTKSRINLNASVQEEPLGQNISLNLGMKSTAGCDKKTLKRDKSNQTILQTLSSIWDVACPTPTPYARMDYYKWQKPPTWAHIITNREVSLELINYVLDEQLSLSERE